MTLSATDKVFLLQILFAVITAMLTFVQGASAQEIPLESSPPAVIYYTTNGADPVVTPTTTYTNYYVAEGTKITPPTATSFTDTPLGASETISLVLNAGKGKPYIKPEKLKIHESKLEFEKHLKQKHGKRYRVEAFRINQTENGLDGYIDIVENKDPAILQLGDKCTEEERAKRIAVAKEFLLNNPEIIGLTENEELRERGIERQYCGGLYFDRYLNGFELLGSVYQIDFVPHWNLSVSVHLNPITPEMYAAAQQEALPPEEIAKIVYSDLNISLGGNADNKLPKFIMRKYLIQKEPYVVWDVRGEYIYKINALTGEIILKKPNVKY